jgi:hypothetical protein
MSTPARDESARHRAIVDLLERLHRHKDAAYGDAWRKRGEVIAIFANIARKYDRLLVAFTEDRAAVAEPLGDTVADLCVYAAKYLSWIADEHPGDLDAAELPVSAVQITDARGPDAVRDLLAAMRDASSDAPLGIDAIWSRIQDSFVALEHALMAQATPGARSEDLLGYSAKAQLAWALSQDSRWLLVRLDERDPTTLAKLRDEVATMDNAHPQP